MLSVNQHTADLTEAQQVTLALMKMPFAFCGVFCILPILIFFSEIEICRGENLKVWRWGQINKVISLQDYASVGLFPWIS